mmetsp:Transcript_27228/g.85754  ORF Transcript_27228/g.85754 Transcript_27228/m.85754 type:complete len:209 (+) Transcript_27228:1135-1761(+)
MVMRLGVDSFSNSRAMPRSATLQVKSSDSRKLELFTSRWICPLLCRCCSPQAASWQIRTRNCQLISCSDSSSCRRLPPRANSVTIQSTCFPCRPGSSQAPISCSTLACWHKRSATSSRSMWPSNCLSERTCRFTATISSVPGTSGEGRFASSTWEKWPRPMTLPMWRGRGERCVRGGKSTIASVSASLGSRGRGASAEPRGSPFTART